MPARIAGAQTAVELGLGLGAVCNLLVPAGTNRLLCEKNEPRKWRRPGSTVSMSVSGTPNQPPMPFHSCFFFFLFSQAVVGRPRPRPRLTFRNLALFPERGVVAKDLTALDGAARHPVVPVPSVIAAKAIRGHRPAKFRRLQDSDVLPDLLTLHLHLKVFQRGIRGSHQRSHAVKNVGMDIEATQLDVVGLALVVEHLLVVLALATYASCFPILFELRPPIVPKRAPELPRVERLVEHRRPVQGADDRGGPGVA